MAGYDHLCLGCMADIGAESVCPHCGYVKGTAAEAPQHLPPGTILQNKYILGRVLGHGGFGITYLAWDTNLNMKLAIKEYMPRDFATRSPEQTVVTVFSGELETHFEKGLKNFLDEAKTVAQFSQHPGIVGVRDFFKENGTAYLVMQYLEGVDFKQYLQSQGGKIPYQTALRIMMPVMDALREVHSTGTLHRDISPDNIYITSEGQVKILDFGAARHAMSEFSKSISVILKPGYAPEEQYRSKGKQGPWTDIYATAATLYRAIMGRVPPESLDRLEDDGLIPPSAEGVDIPREAEVALLKALSVKAADRYQSMGEFQQELLHNMDMIQQDGLVEERVTESQSFKAVPSHSDQKSLIPKWVWFGGGAAIAAILAIVVLGSIFLFNSFSKDDQDKPAETGSENVTENQPVETISEVVVPNLVNSMEEDAKAMLEKEGLKLGQITYVESLYVKKGVVTNQSIEAEQKMKENDLIDLEVSKGVELPLDEETIKTRHLEVVYEYWDQGFEYNQQKNYTEALRYYSQAREMAEILYAIDGNFDAQYSMGVLSRNVSLMKRVLGYAENALLEIQESVEILEDLLTKDPVFKQDYTELANSYGELSYIQFLNEMMEEAVVSAEKSIELSPERVLFKANLAHALLFTDQFDKAMNLYTVHQYDMVAENQVFMDVVLSDFRYFRQQQIIHPDMDHVEDMYTNAESTEDPDVQQIETTITANLLAMEEESVEGYMSTIDPNSPAYENTKKSVEELFAAYDNFKATIESIEVIEINGDTAKARVVQVLTYTDGSQNYESKGQMVHTFVRSNGLFKWLIQGSVVEGG